MFLLPPTGLILGIHCIYLYLNIEANFHGRSEKDEMEAALHAEREKRRLAEATLEEKEEELSAFLSTAQDMRQETRRREEEARDTMSVEAHSKGNSLFSEVEDRRHIVESQLVQVFIKMLVLISTNQGYQLLLIIHKNWNKSLPGLAWCLV